MRIHNLGIAELQNSLHTTLNGLSSAEAEKRLIEFGPNTIVKARGRPMVLRFLEEFTHFFALILWCGAAIAFFAEWKAPGGGMGALGYAILCVIFVNGIFSFWQEYKAEQAIEALQKLIPHTVNALRDGLLSQISAAQLVPGDVIAVEEGDYVAADCRIMEAFGICVNNAVLTGESIPLARSSADSQEEEVLHSSNVLLAGTSMVSGSGKALVFATGMQTEFGKIATMTQSTRESKSPLQLEIVRLSRLIACISVCVGVLFFLIGKAMGINYWDNVLFALGIIVALVPEGLLPEVTLTLASCSQRMAKRQVLVRHLPAVETLGCTTVICTDKTGTLTENKMSVKQVYFCGKALDIGAPELNAPMFVEAFKAAGEVCLNCENAKEIIRDGKTTLSGDPMEIALIEFARLKFPSLSATPQTDQISFDTDRKRLTTIHQLGNDAQPGTRIAYSKGASELLIAICQSVYSENGVISLTSDLRAQYCEAEKQLAGQGLRVLALAQATLAPDCALEQVENNLTLIGLVALEDPPRPEVPDAIRRCKQAGVRVIMITGDHPITAEAIAREIGLTTSKTPLVINGQALKRLSDTQLQLMLSRREVVFARTDAGQKMRIVQSLKRMGHVVATTGDGVNDGPALKAANIGIAMGLIGTDVAREASDIVLADDNFASIVNGIEEGRAVFANIKKFLSYVLASNIAELVPFLTFVLFKVPLPLTIMQVLAIDLGTDLLPALALGTERPDPAVMNNPPRTRKEGLFNRGLIFRAYLYLGAMVSAGSMIAYFHSLHQGGWHYGQMLSTDNSVYRLATTASLMGIMCMQMVNSSICRSDQKSLFVLGPFSNKLLLVGVTLQFGLMLLITYSPVGHAVFSTASLPIQSWLFMLPIMVSMLVIEELRKFFAGKCLATA